MIHRTRCTVPSQTACIKFLHDRAKYGLRASLGFPEVKEMRGPGGLLVYGIFHSFLARLGKDGRFLHSTSSMFTCGV